MGPSESTLTGEQAEEVSYEDSWYLKSSVLSFSTKLVQQERVENLEEEVTYFRKALDAQPLGAPSRPAFLNHLAEAIFIRFQQVSSIPDLEEAIDLFDQAYCLYPPDDPASSFPASNLARARFARFKQLDEMEDLHSAITYHHRALALRPPDHPDRFSSLDDLRVAVSLRFLHLRRQEDLDDMFRFQSQIGYNCVKPPLDTLPDTTEDAIRYFDQALIHRPFGHPGRASFLHGLGALIVVRFKQYGRMGDLEDAIALNCKALSLRLPGHPNRSSSAHNLGTVLFLRFERLGRRKDLDDVIIYTRQALVLRIRGHPARSESLGNLAVALSSRFERLSMTEDLDEAVMYHREAVTLCPLDQLGQSYSLSNLGTALCDRFIHLGRMKDLDEGIMYHRLASEKQHNRALSLHHLGTSLSIRFNQLSKMEDLEQAIRCYRQALTHPPDDLDPYLVHESLGAVFLTRFRHLGSMDDLEEAIKCLRQAPDLCPHNPTRAYPLNGVAAAVFTRFKELGGMEDLEEAGMYYRKALALLSPDHMMRSRIHFNIAATIFHRFKRLDELKDLDDAITCLRQALKLRPPPDPSRSETLDNLAQTVAARFQRLGKEADFEEAIRHFADAQAALPVDHPFHATILSHIASVYLTRPDSDPDHISEAFTFFERATSHRIANPRDQLKAALQWASAARERKHESTVPAYFKVFSLLDRCLWANPTVEMQHRFLLTTKTVPRSLPCDAAASAIEANELEAAVELVERGRTPVWSKMQGYRDSLEQFREVDKPLVTQFQLVSRQLESLAISSGPGSSLTAKDSDTKMQENRRLLEERERLVEKIRQIDGFSHFQRVIPFTTLQRAAAEGPVIIINVSNYRSDALILYGLGLPELVPLPAVSAQYIGSLRSEFSQALTEGSQKGIIEVLRQLWETIVSPVMGKLATLHVPVAGKSRIWWCPTAELCALPLHAAGPYRDGHENLADVYISSYTPTLYSLIRARSNPRPTVTNLLVIGQPGDNLQDGDLPAVRDEIGRIRSLGDFVDVLVAWEAKRQSVLSSLQQHTWVHFACHASQESQPFHSYFELYDDEQLTLVDLMGAKLPHAEFAFLSACHSAAGDIDTPDEVVHLAAALQFCGFRSVIGTLWSMADIDGPDIAEDFYKYMFRTSGGTRDFRESAQALHQATEAMRARKDMTIDRWIKFVHIGA